MKFSYRNYLFLSFFGLNVTVLSHYVFDENKFGYCLYTNDRFLVETKIDQQAVVSKLIHNLQHRNWKIEANSAGDSTSVGIFGDKMYN